MRPAPLRVEARRGRHALGQILDPERLSETINRKGRPTEWPLGPKWPLASQLPSRYPSRYPPLAGELACQAASYPIQLGGALPASS